MKYGKCRLCLLDKNLQDSHLMPKALYRMARGSGRKGNQDPQVFRRTESKPSSHQVTDYVFCHECEQLLNKNGEEYVMGLVTKRDGTFPLLNMLNKVATRMQTPKWRAYSAAETPDIDRAKIAYFALSVFWRASIHTWLRITARESILTSGESTTRNFAAIFLVRGQFRRTLGSSYLYVPMK